MPAPQIVKRDFYPRPEQLLEGCYRPPEIVVRSVRSDGLGSCDFVAGSGVLNSCIRCSCCNCDAILSLRFNTNGGFQPTRHHVDVSFCLIYDNASSLIYDCRPDPT